MNFLRNFYWRQRLKAFRWSAQRDRVIFNRCPRVEWRISAFYHDANWLLRRQDWIANGWDNVVGLPNGANEVATVFINGVEVRGRLL